MSESRQPSQPILPGEAGPRLVAAAGRVLAREVPLALRAAHQFRARPGIALAVVALATIGFFSNIFTRDILRRRSHPEYRPVRSFARLSEQYRDAPFWERWGHEYALGLSSPLVFRPLGAFVSPLARADGVVGGWIRLLSLPVAPLPRDARYRQPRAYVPLMVLYGIGQLVMIVIAVGVFVALLGWMRAGSRWITSDQLRRDWKCYYWPVLAVVMIRFAAWTAIRAPYVAVWPRIAGVPFADPVSQALVAAPRVALMLAPFVVVGMGLGVKRAIVEGLRLLRRRWFALVTLFVLFRVGYEVLRLWEALSPWPASRTYLSLSIPAPVVWVWVSEIGFALLGLWLAYAFMDIAARSGAIGTPPTQPHGLSAGDGA